MKRFLVFFFLLIFANNILFSQDYQPPSSNPPGGLTPEEVPMFVSIGWDDNSHAGFSYPGVEGQAIHWVRDFAMALVNPAGAGNDNTYDGTPVRYSFFNNTVYTSNGTMGDYVQQVKVAWNMCHREGHEIGNHTHSHITSQNGPNYSVSQWENEIVTCNEWLVKPAPHDSDTTNIGMGNTAEGAGIPAEDIKGFRTPYLYYNDNTFTAIQNLGFVYDCSIEDGYQDTMDGTNYLWPYTLDHGSPGHDYLKESGILNDKMKHVTITSHPGLWEMPDHPVIVPPDEACSDYGIQPGLRAKIKAMFSWFDTNTGKITGLDYNLWNGIRLNKGEFLASIKYTLDLRLKGNRAPFLFGAHSQYYNNLWQGLGEPSCENRMWAIEEFIKYVLAKPDVRIVPFIDIIRWCRDPVALNNVSISFEAEKLSPPKGSAIRMSDNGIITVSGLKEGAVTVFNCSGQKVAQGSIRNESSTKPFYLGSGLYVLQVTGHSLNIVQSVVVD